MSEFYELARIKEIPIKELAGELGIEVVTRNGGSWCKLRNEDTASCKLYENTNTFCDFGDGNRGGDVIAFYATAEGVSNTEAIAALAQMFNIGAVYQNKEAVEYSLSNRQFAMIGILAERATLNFDINVEKYGVEKTREFSEKYRISVNELRQQHPKVYTNMLRARAIPFVHQERQDYYLALFSYVSGVGDIDEIKKLETRCNQQNEILKLAVKNTELNYKSVACNIEKDIMKIRSGQIQAECGNVPYMELKASAKKDNDTLRYKEISYPMYQEKRGDLEDVRYAAFLKADKVNLAYGRRDELRIEAAFPQIECKKKQIKK